MIILKDILAGTTAPALQTSNVTLTAMMAALLAAPERKEGQ